MSLVSLDQDGRLWALNTRDCTYVIGIEIDHATGEALVLQKYWGPILPPQAAREAAAMSAGPGSPSGAGRHVTSFSRPVEVEELLPVDGGLRWGLPALQVAVDQVRSLELRLVGVNAASGTGWTSSTSRWKTAPSRSTWCCTPARTPTRTPSPDG